MIDLIQITINIKHEPFGATRTLEREDRKSSTKQMSKTIWIHDAPLFVTSLNSGKKIMIRCCPLKVLQGHNVFGSNNVPKLGYKIITDVLNLLGIEASAHQLNNWREGEFRVTEIHLTNRHPVPSYSMVKPVVSHIHRYSRIALRPSYIDTGVGVTLKAPNLEWIFYDKHLEFGDKRHKEQRYLQARAGSDAEEASRLLHRLASRSIRGELKLYKTYLRDHSLATGKKWTDAKVNEVYLLELGLLRLGEIPSVSQLPRVYRRMKNLSHRTTLILWANGEDISDHYGRTKRGQHRKAIKTELGIDILKDKPVLGRPRIKLSEIFNPTNMLTGFPKWARKYPQLAFR